MEPTQKEVDETIGALLDAKARFDAADAARTDAEEALRVARVALHDMLKAVGEEAVEVYSRDRVRMVVSFDRWGGLHIVPLAIPEDLATGEPL